MTARVRVLHVISNLMSGGAETMLSKVARATAQSGIEHTVVSMVEGGRIAEELAQAGIVVRTLGVRRNIGAALRIGSLRRIVRETAPDLVQGWMYHGNLAATAAAGRQVPALWNVRQSLATLRAEQPLTRLVILAGALMSRTPAAIVYNSLRAAEDHERFGYAHDRRVIIPNGFDTDIFRPDPARRAQLVAQLRLPPDAVIVGRVANFHLHKDYPTLLAAFDRIARADPRAHLVLIGRGLGSDNVALGPLIATLPAPQKVHILGERADVAELVPAFDVMLSSSSAEAFPNVVGEAMCCAVPTVATDAGDCRKILGDPARIVPLRDADGLARVTIDILSLDPARRAEIGARDRQRAIAGYSIGAVAAAYAGLWQTEIKKRR